MRASKAKRNPGIRAANHIIPFSQLELGSMAQTATLPQPPSFDDHLASMDSLPLFMSSLPDDPTDNAALSALQSLIHDGTPDGWCVSFCVLPRPR